VKRPTLAFPNAYLETDEPPRKILREKGLSLLAVVGTSYFAVTVLLLSLFDPDYSPISKVASDYGVGRFAIEMNVGFLLGGIGILAFVAHLLRTAGGPKSRIALALLTLSGLILATDSLVIADLEGTSPTLHGTIHGLGGFFFFVAAPVGVILVTRRIGSRLFLAAVVSFAIGFGFLFSSSLLALNAGGLAERIIIETILLSIAYSSVASTG